MDMPVVGLLCSLLLAVINCKQAVQNAVCIVSHLPLLLCYLQLYSSLCNYRVFSSLENEIKALLTNGLASLIKWVIVKAMLEQLIRRNL